MAVEDWQPMLDQLDRTIDQIRKSPPPLNKEGVAESVALLEWIRDEHFTFLGFREYTYQIKKGSDAFKATEKFRLGVLRATGSVDIAHLALANRVVRSLLAAR